MLVKILSLLCGNIKLKNATVLYMFSGSACFSIGFALMGATMMPSLPLVLQCGVECSCDQGGSEGSAVRIAVRTAVRKL